MNDRQGPSSPGLAGERTLEHFKRVNRVLLLAMALPPEARAAALDRECADDPELRSEVESLLSHQKDASLLDRGPGDLEETDGRPWELRTGGSSADSPVGQRIGTISIERELAAGGSQGRSSTSCR